MSVEERIESQLGAYAAALDIGEIIGAAEVGVMSRRRGRRNRLRAGLGAAVVTLVAIVGVGSTLRSPENNAVFAGATSEQAQSRTIAPSAAVHDGKRFVGVAPLDPIDYVTRENQRFVVVTSQDGSTWKQAGDGGTLEATSIEVAHHRDEVFLISIRLMAPLPGVDQRRFELATFRSTNLTDWQSTHQILDADLIAADSMPVVVGAVVADAGLLVQIGSRWAGPSAEFIGLLERRGLDPDGVCDLTYSGTEATFRVCGATEAIEVELELGQPLADPKHTLLFARHDGSFEVVPRPGGDRPAGPVDTIYSIPDGFGFSGSSAFRSTDGATWIKDDAAGDAGVMVAVRGTETVLAMPFGLQRFDTDDPITSFAYRRGDSDLQRIDLGSLYEGATAPRWFNDLQVGQAGWTMVGQRSFGQAQFAEGVVRDRTGASDFTVTSDGYVLAGLYPFGPASLSDPDGVVIRTWDQFEATRPDQSGFTIDHHGVFLVNETSSEPTVVFTLAQWASLQDPLDAVEYDLLFSPDGRSWQILQTSSPMPHVLAIGDDTVVVRQLEAPFAYKLSPLVEAIPVPARD